MILNISVSSQLLFASQISAALSTLIFLAVTKDKIWASEFLFLYSLSALFSGGLNTAIYFLVAIRPRVYSRVFAIALFLVSTIIAFLVSSQSIQPVTNPNERLLLLLGMLSPLLMAPGFGVLYRLGQQNKVFILNIGMNFGIVICAAISALLFTDPSSFYFWNGLSTAIVVGAIWILVGTPIAHTSKLEASWRIAALNPSLPILEKVVWDQGVLNGLQLKELSWPIFVATKLITFFGGLVFTKATFESIQGKGVNIEKGKRLEVLIFSFLVLLSFGVAIVPAIGPIVTCLFSWVLGVKLMRCGLDSKIYGRVLGVWLLDFLIRLVILGLGANGAIYYMFISGINTIMVGLVFFWPPLQPQEKRP